MSSSPSPSPSPSQIPSVQGNSEDTKNDVNWWWVLFLLFIIVFFFIVFFLIIKKTTGNGNVNRGNGIKNMRLNNTRV
jgi:hypothetical protein